MPETTNMSPEVKPAATVDIQPATAPVNAQPKRRAFWQRRGVWLIATLLLVGIAVFGYHWAFGKAKVHWMTIGRTPETGLPVFRLEQLLAAVADALNDKPSRE